jgi:hypothetical protein
VRRSPRRFTLLEILVATSILVVLGTALMVILRGGLATWRRSEARRESFDMAQAIFLQLRDDLGSAIAPPPTPLPGLGEVESRLMYIQPPKGRPQLFLVRSIKAENEHPITGHAGSEIGADRVVDQRDDLAEARQSRLRATGGAMEVAWVLGEGGVLYRGIRSPVGPPGSLFDVGAFQLAPLLAKGTPPPGAAAEPAGTPASASSSAALLRPFALRVIHFECLFWTQFTRTWSTRFPALRDPRSDQVPGPLDYWDSTRGMIQFTGAPKGEFHTFRSADSLTDPRDDIYPSMVQVRVVFEEPSAAKSSTFLASPVTQAATEVVVEDASRFKPRGFVYVNSEWIEYDEIEGNTLQVSKRGARHTVAQAHEGFEEVFAGRQFTTVIDVPAWREDLSERRP